MNKYDEEKKFWLYEKTRLENLYESKPEWKEKYDNAMDAWLEEFQKPNYLYALDCDKDTFKGMNMVEIGGGPFPSATAFNYSSIENIDPLMEFYVDHFHEFESDEYWWSDDNAEDTVYLDNEFGAVISVNAIDHVDNFEAVAKELKRICKPSVKFAMHVHYHKATPCEPIEITDERFAKAFDWVPNLKVHKRSRTKDLGQFTCNPDEEFVVWRNF